MQYSGNNSDGNLKLRGKTAIDAEHKNIPMEDEKRVTNKISDMYGIDSDEAKDIHRDYHLNRIVVLLLDRAKKHGMTESMFIDRIKSFDMIRYAHSVSQGELMEIAAVDILYRELCSLENNNLEDRYINYYG